ncbi:hypothetical protein [Halpernia frigidisoli]|uniref:Uncharacterized protein n=1 Tax=Halpernia frigidisoli TaxID=1125876 RepID=A0A1I3ECG1_9FLAO|nr:hypothetical protein [Halpernia frigidisoli]SFH96667.1 hypothetical protein SAMN05443292_0997 [Halpernia frigidisoli]
MKYLIKLSLAILVFSAVSCAQNKEKREEFKEEHSVEEKRVDGTAPAAASSEGVPVDSTKIEKMDETK